MHPCSFSIMSQISCGSFSSTVMRSRIPPFLRSLPNICHDCVALGEACTFVVGQRTDKLRRNERSGEPVTLRMESGDAMFFDGGSIPHKVGPLHAGTASKFFQQKCAEKELFRENMGGP